MELDFAALLDATADSMIVVDEQGAIVYANRAVERLLGWAPHELVGRPLTMLMPERMRAPHLAGFERYRRTREPHGIGRSVRVPALHRDGRVIDVELALSAMPSGDRELYVGVMRDLRDRVEVERHLGITRYLRGLASAAVELSGRLDAGRVARMAVATLTRELDAQVAGVWRYDAAAHALELVAGEGLDEQRAHIDVARYPFAVAEAARRREPLVTNRVTGDVRFDPTLAKRGPLEAAAVFPLLVAGQLRGVMAAMFARRLDDQVVDVLHSFSALVGRALEGAGRLERAEAERARAAEQQLWLEALLDRLPSALVLVEPGTARMLFANRAALELAGGDITRATGSTPGHYCVDADGKRIPDAEKPVARAARGEQLVDEQFEWVTPSGRQSLLVNASTVPAMFGHEATAIVTFTDVTRLVRVERELAEAVDARDQFLSIASHELKTPLTSLRLEVQGLLRAARSGAWNDGLGERFERIERLVGRQAKLIEDLLDISRLVEGRLELRLEKVDLAAVARAVAERFRAELEEAGCELRLCVGPPLVGRWDPLRIDQIVSNLLGNAVKYGRGKPIELSVTGVDGRARLVVRDNGIGIDRADQKRIFERFARAVSEKHYGGFGLGLWITRQIVEALGGTIAVESGPGRGARFTVDLPTEPR